MYKKLVLLLILTLTLASCSSVPALIKKEPFKTIEFGLDDNGVYKQIVSDNDMLITVWVKKVRQGYVSVEARAEWKKLPEKMLTDCFAIGIRHGSMPIESLFGEIEYRYTCENEEKVAQVQFNRLDVNDRFIYAIADAGTGRGFIFDIDNDIPETVNWKQVTGVIVTFKAEVNCTEELFDFCVSYDKAITKFDVKKAIGSTKGSFDIGYALGVTDGKDVYRRTFYNEEPIDIS